jgi:hypothetical protein
MGAGVTATKKLAAVKKKDPAIFQQAKEGRITVAEAERLVRTRPDPHGDPAVESGSWELLVGDLTASKDIEEHSVDLVLVDWRTSPELIAARAYADVAKRILKPGASFVVLIDSARLTNLTAPYFVFGYFFPFSRATEGRDTRNKIISAWHFAVRFVMNGEPSDWVRDDLCCGPSGHAITKLIASLSLSKNGSTVVDLTCRDDAIGKAVVSTGRRFIGVVADEGCKERIDGMLKAGLPTSVKGTGGS